MVIAGIRTAWGRQAVLALFVLAACEGDGTDKTRDYGVDAKNLSTLRAGIWIDPYGCDHWIIDDGLEGYLTDRRDRSGKPVCSGRAPPNTTIAAEDI